MNSTLRAALYLRVSTDEQAASGLGLAAQEERARALAVARGWKVAACYRDEGISGTTDPKSRPEASRMLADASAGLLDVVIVLKVDRLARRAEYVHRTLRELDAIGVAFASVSEPFDTSSAMGAAFLGVTAVFAQLERDLIAERTKAALAVKRARGERVGAPRLGLRVVDGKAQEIVEEAETVTRMRSLRDQGLSLSAIAAQLTAEGRQTKRGGRWGHSNVRSVLSRAA